MYSDRGKGKFRLSNLKNKMQNAVKNLLKNWLNLFLGTIKTRLDKVTNAHSKEKSFLSK